MLKEAIYHINDIPYLFSIGNQEVKIRIRAKRGEVFECSLLHSDRYQPPGNGRTMTLTLVATTETHDYFEGLVFAESKRLRYQFLLTGYDGTQVWYGEEGVSGNRESAGCFYCASTAAADEGTPPAWTKDAVVYQIFPDRFCNGNPSNAPDNVRCWTSKERPEWNSFYGGDLRGILDKLPYLVDLGVNVVYLTPIFESPSNHKYDTSDYYAIDPRFGYMSELKSLVDRAHALNVKVILDAVFNHSGDRFFAFRDVMEKGEESKYKDWFFIDGFPVVQGKEQNYESFGIQTSSMPKLNTKNPEVVRYLLDVAKYWIREAGIDGWRLDVANEIDHAFWRRLRQEVKGIDRELLLVGEIMHRSGPWLRGDQFDGVMNYSLRDAMVDFFAKHAITARVFAGQIESIRMSYTDHANSAMLNLIGSHDTARFLTLCSESAWGWQNKREIDRFKLAVLFQLTYLGMPMIYYGDEVGMTGGEDPDCRKPMEWGAARNEQLLAHYKKLIRLRAEHSALRGGEFRMWFIEESLNSFGFIRYDSDQCIGIILNNSPEQQLYKPNMPHGTDYSSVANLFGDNDFDWTGNKITVSLPPYGAQILLFS